MTQTLEAMKLETVHITGSACISGIGDTIARRWSEVTCAACIALMPSTADNGCRHERMIWIGRNTCPMTGRLLSTEAWQCPSCGYKQSRLVSTASLLTDSARVLADVRALVLS